MGKPSEWQDQLDCTISEPLGMRENSLFSLADASKSEAPVCSAHDLLAV